jgi:hypothetical protein
MDFEEQQVAPEALEQSFEPEPEKAPEHDADADQKGEAELADVGLEGEDADRRAKALKGTKHRKATLSLGTQVGPDGKPTGAPKPHAEAKVADATRVDIVAGKGSPLVKAHGDIPAETDLFTRPASGGHKVTHRSGSVASPNVDPTMAPDNLFIDGAPHAEDVRQGGIGNCFFQSCLLAITQNDPGKITSVMGMSGHDVAVTLLHLDKAGNHVPKTIKTSTTLLTRKAPDGTIKLKGARMRIADAPKKVEWWAEVHGKTVKIQRRDVYETALWSPMMEKAHADFTQQFGADGTGLDIKDKKKGTSGYEILNRGGSSENCYQLFYGDQATPNRESINFTPGSDIIAGNKAAIRQLLLYETQKGNTAAGTTQRFMHARIGNEGACKRGDALIDQVNQLLFAEQLFDDLGAAIAGETQMQTIQRLLRTVDRTLLRTSLTALQTTLKGAVAAPPTAKASDVAKAAEPIQKPDVFPHLWDDSLPAPFTHLRENLGILINLGDDSSPGRRQNYAGHAYQVRAIHFADKTGAPVALTLADLDAKLGDIDPLKSSVEMHNPHATNEPDLRGNGPADGKDDGMFSYTLDQFLRNFDLLRFCDVAH